MNNLNVKLALVPLDERPVNTKYPQIVAQIAGAELLLPPEEIRGSKRTPADLGKLAEWLTSVAQDCLAALISCDYLGYGNLINARISSDSAATVIARLSLLTDLPCPVHAFSLITRVSNADDNVEEPIYWKDWGTKFYKFSDLTHKEMTGANDEAHDKHQYVALASSIPQQEKSDWLVRRLRNHAVNLALIDLVAHNEIASLLLTSDDTSTWGFPSRERAWIKSWKTLLPELGDRVAMHPGADEVGTALVAKMINHAHGRKPAIWVEYAIEEDSARIAPYEDRPVRKTIIGQIKACGAEVAASPAFADLILGVLTPSPNGKDYQESFIEAERASRTKPYTALFDRLSKFQSSGMPVMLADVAYPNGADPLAMEILVGTDTPLSLGSLAAYGAWNTAGNTLGVVIAQGVSSLYIGGNDARLLAQKIFLTHRFLEDWGYQSVVRREARAFAEMKWNRRDPDPESLSEIDEICDFIEERLAKILDRIQQLGIGVGLAIAPNSTRLPWNRTFEVDFVLIHR